MNLREKYLACRSRSLYPAVRLFLKATGRAKHRGAVTV
jgi:hypothetical protein